MTPLRQVSLIGVAAFLVSLIASVMWRGSADLGTLQVLVAAAYFLFGVFVAFALDSARNRMSKVDDLLKVDEANLLALYELAGALGEKEQAHITELIDLHMQDQIDYRLNDFDRSGPSHLRILRYVAATAADDTVGSSIVREQMLTLILQTNANRPQVETSTGSGLSKAEWTCIFVLFAMLYLTLPLFDTGTLFGSLLVAMLSSTLAVFVAILWKVDHLRWQEGDWIWKPLDRLFRNIGKLPYYPRPLLEQKRAMPQGPIRIADYPHPYPEVEGKTVTEAEWPPR
jgi:hypothetical protein